MFSGGVERDQWHEIALFSFLHGNKSIKWSKFQSSKLKVSKIRDRIMSTTCSKLTKTLKQDLLVWF